MTGEIQTGGAQDPSLAGRYWTWAVLLVVLLFVAAIRIRLADVPLERDEGDYAYAGQIILRKTLPYSEIYYMKVPGIYAAYAIILAVFGQTAAGVHYGLIVVNAATALLLFLIVRRLFDPIAGVVAGACYALLSVGQSVLGLAANAEHFILLPALAGILLLMKAVESDRLWTVFVSGLLLGSSIMVKQNGMFFAAFGGYYLLWSEMKTRPIRWPRASLKTGLLILGGFLPFALTILMLLAAGLFAKFYYWDFQYFGDYVNQFTLSKGIGIFWRHLLSVMAPSYLLWALGGVGLIALFLDAKARARAPFVLGFLVFSLIAIFPGFYFREHYFILLLPAVSLLVGVGVSTSRAILSRRFLSAAWGAVPIGLFLIAFGLTIFLQKSIFFEMTPHQVSRASYGPNPFLETVEIANYIKERTTPEDRIAVIGSEPEIFFYSRRHTATGYIYTYSLTSGKYALEMQKEMIREIEAARPRYLVFVNIESSWLLGPNSERLILEWAPRYVQKYYERVGVVDILSPELTKYAWDGEAIGYNPRSSYYIYVFKRKPLLGG